jgi:Secretion system C-terminal sorting domain
LCVNAQIQLMKKHCIGLFACLSCFFLQAQVQFLTSGYTPGANGAALVTLNTSLNTSVNRNFYITDPTTCVFFTEGPDGKLYGTAIWGGTNYNGVIFSVNPDGSNFSIIYNAAPAQFIGNYTTLVFGQDGKIYVTLSGYLWRIEPDGSGATQIAAVVDSRGDITIDANGWIYGIGNTIAFNSFFAYKIKIDGSGYQVLHNFVDAIDGSDLAKLCITPTGRLFVVSNRGGSNSGGAFISFRTDGTDFTIHHAFYNSGNPDYDIFGAAPVVSRLVAPLHHNGKIYFTTSAGGTAGLGAFLLYDTLAATLGVIHHVQAGEATKPESPIFVNGKLAGKNSAGIYNINADGSNFQQLVYINNLQQLNQINGTELLVYSPGTAKLYTIISGGAYKNTSILQTDEGGGGAFAVHDFGNVPGGYNPDGITKGADGKLYGILHNGGAEGGGLLYKMNPDGSAYQIIYDFTGATGQWPIGQLLYGSDGKLYGVCDRSGISGLNTNQLIYAVNTDGSGYSVLRIFDVALDGPLVPELTENKGDTLFGMTGIHGVYTDVSKIFRIKKNGTAYTVLKTISPTRNEGEAPRQSLVWVNGFLYGSMANGGMLGAGVIFRIKEDGSRFKLIKEFNGSDASLLMGGLTLASNNKLYGTSWFGGTNYAGTIFTINPVDSSFQNVYNFNSATDGTDFPYGRVTQASDGRLYIAKGEGIFGINLNGTGRSFYKPASYFYAYGNNNMAVAYLTEVPFVALPVKQIANFNVYKQAGIVMLKWQTVEERNLNNFDIERSNNGISFRSVGTLKAKGNTVSTTNYTAEDLNPLTGKNYYRLKMTDNDGTFSYSDIRAVDFIKAVKLTLYPNPADNELTISHGFTGTTGITITDLAGSKIYTTSTRQPVFSVNLKNMKAGLYKVTIQNKNQVQTAGFIKR